MNHRDRKHLVVNRCRQCGMEFEQPASRVWRDHFCSSRCGYAHRQDKRMASTKKCATCGAEFRPRQNVVAKGRGKFCSQKCNTARITALNSAESQAKSKATFRKKLADGSIVAKKGTKHYNWKGGADAARARREERTAKRVADGSSAAALREYRKKNPEKVAEWGQSRRSSKIGRVPRGTVWRLRVTQGDACTYCGAAIPPYHLEHKLPVSRGGTNAESNLHLTCPRCNLRKSDLTHEEFLVSKRRRVHKENACQSQT